MIEKFMSNFIEELYKVVEVGGGKECIEKQYVVGKMIVCECIDVLFDLGFFVELDKFKMYCCVDFGMQDKKVYGDGVVIGYGLLDGRKVFVFVQDFIVYGGSFSGVFVEKICKIMD